MLLGLSPWSPASLELLSGEEVAELLGTVVPSWSNSLIPSITCNISWLGVVAVAWTVVAGVPLLGLRLWPAGGMSAACTCTPPWLRVKGLPA